MPPEYTQPLFAQFSAVPMFGGYGGPTGGNPFNFGGLTDSPIMQMALPVALQYMAAANGTMPFQYAPSQNIFEQLLAQRYMREEQQAVTRATATDQAQIEETLQGASRLFTGAPVTFSTQQQTHAMAGMVSSALPYIMPFIGEDMVDQLMGSRGSAAVMAQAMHRGFRLGRDPVTGAPGGSGESAAVVAQTVYDQFFGRGADPAKMRGFSAGQLGHMYEELVLRGQVPVGAGALSGQERFKQIAAHTLTPDEVRQMAEHSDIIRGIRDRGDDPTAKDFEAAESRIRDTHKRIQAGVARGDDVAKLAELPDAADLLRSGDARRIASKLESLSGVVAAMRDIFGDMGQPNAPMRQLIGGLESLTQGGLAQLSPGELERTVRATHNLATRSGIGVEGMIGLTTHAANMTDSLGIHRVAAVQATQHAAAFSAAAREQLHLDDKVFGAKNVEELTLLDQQLTVNAAASPLNRQLAATVAMAERGQVKEGTEAWRLAQAIKSHSATYSPSGKPGDTASVVQQHDDWLRMIEDSGGLPGLAAAIYDDQTTLQRFSTQFNIPTLTRRMQRNVDHGALISEGFSAPLNTLLNRTPIYDKLKKQVKSEQAFSDIMTQGGTDLYDAVMSIPADELSDEKRPAAMGRAVHKTIEKLARNAAARSGLKGKEADKYVQDVLTATSKEQTESIGMGIESRINTAMSRNRDYAGMQAVDFFRLYNTNVLQASEAIQAEETLKGQMQSALSGLGQASPLARLMDTIRGATPATSLTDAILQGAGALDIDKIRQKLPQVEALMQSQDRFRLAERDKTGNLTPRGMQQQQAETELAKALFEGGDVAAQELERYVKATGKTTAPEAVQFLESRIAAETDGEKKKELEGKLARIRGLQAAKMSLPLSLRDMGVAVGANVSEAYMQSHVTRAASIQADLLKSTAAVDAEGKPDTAARKIAADKVRASIPKLLEAAKNVPEAFRVSIPDMEVIGSDALQIMDEFDEARTHIAELITTVEHPFADILTGAAGSPEEQAAARSYYDTISTNLGKLHQRVKSSDRPGVGSRQLEEPLSPAQIEFLRQENEYRKATGADDAAGQTLKARAAVRELRRQIPASQAFDENFMITQLAEDSRGAPLMRALLGRNKLLQYAKSEKIPGAEEASPAAQDAAIEALMKAVPESAEFQEFYKLAAPLMKLNILDETTSKSLLDTLPTEKLMTAAADEKKTMVATGTLKLLGLDRVMMDIQMATDAFSYETVG